MKTIVFFLLVLCFIMVGGLLTSNSALSSDIGHGKRGVTEWPPQELRQLMDLPDPSAMTAAPLPQNTARMADIRVPFLPNRGQLDQRVSYYARTFSGTMFVTRYGELVYSLSLADKGRSLSPQQTGAETSQIRQMVFMEKLGDSMLIPVAPEGQVTTSVSIFHGDDPQKWQHDLPGFPEISLGQVYPGIEVRLAAHAGSVEKLFYVAAGARPKDIEIAVSEDAGLSVTADGQLEVSTPAGRISFSRPVAWQDIKGKREKVEVAYAVNPALPHSYGFTLGSYDSRFPLVIDPLLQSSYLGGGSNDQANDIAIGPNGSVYVVGYTNSNDFPVCSGSVYPLKTINSMAVQRPLLHE